MEYYSAIKKNKLQMHITTWMDFKNVLSEKEIYTETYVLLNMT